MILLHTGFALHHNRASFGCRTIHEVFQNFWVRTGELFMSRPDQFNPVEETLGSIKHREIIEQQNEMAYGISQSSRNLTHTHTHTHTHIYIYKETIYVYIK